MAIFLIKNPVGLRKSKLVDFAPMLTMSVSGVVSSILCMVAFRALKSSTGAGVIWIGLRWRLEIQKEDISIYREGINV